MATVGIVFQANTNHIAIWNRLNQRIRVEANMLQIILVNLQRDQYSNNQCTHRKNKQTGTGHAKNLANSHAMTEQLQRV
jgi:hypothetical protein